MKVTFKQLHKFQFALSFGLHFHNQQIILNVIQLKTRLSKTTKQIVPKFIMDRIISSAQAYQGKGNRTGHNDQVLL